jgi:hypothetical protein
MKRIPPKNWWWLILLLLLIIAVIYYFYTRPVAYSSGITNITSYGIDKPGDFCRYKVDTLFGKADDPADTGSSTYKHNEQVCLLCTSGQSLCNDSLTIQDPAGRRYGISLVKTGASGVPTCGSCTGANTRKIQRR